jgi:hypothetical protein
MPQVKGQLQYGVRSVFHMVFPWEKVDIVQPPAISLSPPRGSGRWCGIDGLPFGDWRNFWRITGDIRELG